jgi:hypothetical protein
MPRPADRSRMNGALVSLEPDPAPIAESAPVEPEALVAVTEAPAQPVSSASAGAFVQVASMPSEADANSQVASQTSKFGSLFEGNQLMVQQVDLGSKGVRYRVRLPAASLTDATRICASIKAKGGDCFATNS